MATKRARTSARMAGARMTDPGTRGGFTIIEVVLVLAIAGLIFLMVFIALPALQRSQRDTQRRNDLARITEAITQYQTNNNGRLPGIARCDPVEENDDGLVPMDTYTGGGGGGNSTGNSACQFITRYLNAANATNNEYTDPDGWAYGISFETAPAGTSGGSGSSEIVLPNTVTTFGDYLIRVYKGAKCGVNEGTLVGGQPRDYAVVYMTESSGVYCQSNG